jgi:Tol biopolymer transport system component/imidazolonepropionase-like amidohydrolase
MSLDVSPDGQTIVFDLLGDLYTVPITGGTPTQLTSGMALDAQPRYSPDGTRIVFTSDRDGGENVWIMSVDGSDTTQITSDRHDAYISPEWTPDGNYVVASKGRNSKLWMYHVDGGSGVQLLEEPANLKMIGAAFGADDRYIWVAQRTGSWSYNAQFPQYQLAVYDRETGERYTRSSRYGSAFRPTLSPDGRWLVYGTRHDVDTGLRIRDLQTGDERWLAYPVQRDDQESPATRDVYPAMSFTPDSREVVATYGGKIWRIPVDGGDPAQVPFEVDVNMQIGPALDFDYDIPDDPTFVVKQIRDAVPSPDGRRITFAALSKLYVMEYPGGTPQLITDVDAAAHHPTWSPDGRWVAFVTWSEADGGHIYRTRADRQSGTERLTRTPGFFRETAWSPDGERIVAIRATARGFQEGDNTGADIVWIDADDGGDVTVVTPAGGTQRPHFTTDPSRIYAHRRGAGLISMRWDGTDIKEHVQVRGQRPFRGAGGPGGPTASLIMMAPQGDQALAQVMNEIFVVTVPRVGGETPSISVANPDNAAFPTRRITEIGGQFPAWESNGRRVHFSIGNAHLVYDLDAAQAFDDSVEAAEAAQAEPDEEEEEEEEEEEAEGDEPDDGYTPAETRINIDATRDTPQGVAVLRGARVITMRGDEVIENADILVRDNRIAAVGRQGTVQVPGDAEVIDVSGKTIVPGFVDTHAHLRVSRNIHRSQVWSYLANLAYGVTTTRDPQTGSTDVLSYEDMVTAGDIVGPRIYSTGPGVGTFTNGNIRNEQHAKNLLKQYSEYYDTKTIKMYVSGNRQERQWIIQAARNERLMPTTEGALDLKLNLTNTIDGYPGMEHSIPIYPLYKDLIELFAQSGRTYTPTLLVSYGGPWAENYYYTTEEVHDNEKLRRFTPHAVIDRVSRRRGNNAGPSGWFRDEEHIFSRHAEFVRDIVAAGGRAGVGSHGQLQGLGYHWELWSVQAGGMSEHDALRVATIFGAEAIGLERQLGTIETSKLADVLVLNANPLDDIRNTDTIQYVMKNGRLYEGDTLDEVWPRQHKLAGIYWWNDSPDVAAGIH